MRQFLAAAACVLAGLLFGVLIAVAYWVVWLIRNGHAVTDAAQGRVEDGVGTLYGLVTLGTIVGAGVGLAAALYAATKRLR